MELGAGFLWSSLHNIDKEFDYIIVGCGSAGSTVALRLSKDTNVTVLVLEAGPRGTSWFDIPAVGILFQLSSIDWKYKTVPQENAAKAFKDQAINWPRGRVVGGTGRLNNMLYLRGHPDEFKDWVQDHEEYDYDYDILQYFKKSEDYRGTYRSDTKHHSSGGHLPVNDQITETPLASAFLDAAQLLGYPIRDINGRYSTGFMRPQVNVKFGMRWTPAHHLFLQTRPNLVLQTNTHVDEILFKNDYEAYGIRYTYLGRGYKVRARKGVVLSAGVIETPKLLMLSGVGPKEHLNDARVRTKVNLPVGDNLQDHVTTGADLVLLNTSLGINPPNMMSLFTAYDYFVRSSGFWTSVGCEAIGVIHTNKSFDQPDLELMALPIGASSDGGRHLVKAGGFTHLVWEKYFARFVGENVVSILPIVLHPKSRGTVRLNVNDPFGQPIINPKYLTDPYDVDVLIKGIELIKKIISTSPMQRLGAKLNSMKFPGCENLEFDTRLYWECYVRHMTMTSYHPVGTCKVGASGKDSVVGYDFRVHGTNKLFVADASVIPSSLSANPNAAIVMLGEKVAASIMSYNYLIDNHCTLIEVFVSKQFC
ncbi:hypothetical protein FQR65_LT05915 [Abscondita terminalis]|nr:hypothetical protein FQR65_LT05915 [Abscondita terminalis]